MGSGGVGAEAVYGLQMSELLPRCSYEYFAMNSLWKAARRRITSSSWSSGGRNVVRKCHVPSA